MTCACVRLQWNQDGRSRSDCSLPAAPFVHDEPFLAIQAKELLMVHVMTFAFAQNVQSPLVKSEALMGKCD